MVAQPKESSVYVLIPYREEDYKNVLKILNSLCNYKVKIYAVGPVSIKRRNVVSIIEKKPKGKSYWIKHVLLSRKDGISVLISGDVRVDKTFLKRILELFRRNKDVGMICFRVKPKKENTLVGKLYESVWLVHNTASKLQPKGGEAIAFRNGVVKKFHEKVVTDEAYIEANIVNSGYKVFYDYTTLIKNEAPRKFSEFFSQRVRYHIGHLQTKKETGYKVVSLNYLLLAKAVVMILKKKPNFFPYFLFVILVEAIARIYGRFLFFLGRLPYKWKIVRSARS